MPKKIIHYSRTPLAGAPYHIVQCLKKYTNYDVHLINEKISYPDKRIFPEEVLLKSEKSKKLLREADIIHFHNQIPGNVKEYIDKRRQKIFITAHSVPPSPHWRTSILMADKKFVIKQPYQTEIYGEEFQCLPTPIDVEHYAPGKKSDVIEITYAPSIRSGSRHKASKGFPEVCSVLNKIRSKFAEKVKINIYWDKTHLEDLKIKSRSHIIIDDIIHPTYHLTSLFGASMGCLVFNGMSSSNMINFYKKFFGKDIKSSPWTVAGEGDLKSKIEYYIINKDKMFEVMNHNRKWMEENYHPKNLIQEYIQIYENLV